MLDLLHTVKWDQDGSLTFRRSCAHGVCGSDAMLINGRNRLACKIRVDQLGKKISVAPLPGLQVIKDLVVDMDEFFAKYRSVMPFQVDDGVMPARERRQSPGGPRALRRHHQVHPVRRLHQLLPQLLGAGQLRRAGGDRERAPVHLRHPRRRGGRAAGDPVRRGRRVALPHDLQLHGRLPAGHQHHARHPRGLVGHRGARGLNLPVDEVDGIGGCRASPGCLAGQSSGWSSAPTARRAATRAARRRAPCSSTRRRPDAFEPDAMAVAVVARDLGIRTNNVAEYAGLVLALREAALLGAREIDLRLDSKLIVEQLNGRWRVKDAKLQGLFAEAIRHLKALRRWSAVHEPRARNRAADALANMALDDPFGAERVIAEVRRRADAG